MHKQRMQPAVLGIALVLVLAASSSAMARTIELDASSIDRAAVISAEAPLAGWAGHQAHTNVWRSF